ncbi:ChbG/HpnK family deacetylase [Polymorphum gilvum]|uniref:YdjC-like protein n=1 Tax=Polymorphum gilvum (strain LMG 25793 / CGMCC 1.9160 / SL003B-26A1) TaxID=991905 RepID=F2J048_POLGS|nr:ChbG/HpnK family deacetylase [Polymorphum gilvum]ADZ71884.1 hypothetical protein SL003B_3461 [Polymorphum gilvum SL003B-26A1]
MKRITLAAVDYGLAFGVDRAVRSLLAARRLSAVGCLVCTDLWSREYLPLRELAEQEAGHALIGLTVALSGRTGEPCSLRWRDTFGASFRTPGWISRRATLRLLPDEIVRSEIVAQIRLFADYFGRAPDFVTLRDGLMRHRVIAGLLMKAVADCGLKKPPLLIFPLAEGWRARRFARFAAKHGLKTLPCGPLLPALEDRAALQQALRGHFDGLADMTFVACMPAVPDDRLRRIESRHQVAVRACQFDVLMSDEFFRTLDEKDVFLY